MAGRIGRHPVILEMLGGNMIGVIHVEALSVGNHDVARNAESSLFGALHVRVHAAHNAESGKHTQANESHDLPASRTRKRRPNQKDRGQCDAEHNLTNENPNQRTSFRLLSEFESQ
jgi:hypothetical protein